MKKPNSFFQSFTLFISLTLGLISHHSYADEFSSALEMLIEEARAQKNYYSDLIPELEEENNRLWRLGHKGAYPELNSTLFDYPVNYFQNAQQSILFWETVEFHFERFHIFYSQLPDHAYRTQPIQKLILESAYELNRSVTMAFADLANYIRSLQESYHSTTKGNKFDKARRPTQITLDHIVSEIVKIEKKVARNNGDHPIWIVPEIALLNEALTELNNPLFYNQYYADLSRSLALTKFLMSFYTGASSDLRQREDEEQELKRWVVEILSQFTFSREALSVCTYYKVRKFELNEVLLPEDRIQKIRLSLKRSLLTKHLKLWEQKDQIERECITQKPQGLPSQENPPSSTAEEIANPTPSELSLDTPQARPAEIDPLKNLDLDSAQKEELKTTQDTPLLSQAPRRYQAKKSAAEKKEKEEEEEDEEGAALPSIQKDNYLQAYLEEHHYYQTLKAQRQRTTQTDLSPQGDPPSSQGSAAETSPREKRIQLSGDSAITYLTVMGEAATASRKITNADVEKLVKALGGRIDRQTRDRRFALPNRNPEHKSDELTFKVHFRHSGSEPFPLGTLRNFVGSAIKRAGLDRFVDINEI